MSFSSDSFLYLLTKYDAENYAANIAIAQCVLWMLIDSIGLSFGNKILDFKYTRIGILKTGDSCVQVVVFTRICSLIVL